MAAMHRALISRMPSDGWSRAMNGRLSSAITVRGLMALVSLMGESAPQA
jgi:hypothetical protein